MMFFTHRNLHSRHEASRAQLIKENHMPSIETP